MNRKTGLTVLSILYCHFAISFECFENGLYLFFIYALTQKSKISTKPDEMKLNDRKDVFWYNFFFICNTCNETVVGPAMSKLEEKSLLLDMFSTCYQQVVAIMWDIDIYRCTHLHNF